MKHLQIFFPGKKVMLDSMCCVSVIFQFSLLQWIDTHTHTHTHTHTQTEILYLDLNWLRKTSEWRPIAIPGVSCRLFWEPCVSCWLLTSVCVCERECVWFPLTGIWQVRVVCVCVCLKRESLPAWNSAPWP